MPGSRSDSSKKESGRLKPLSASDERKIDAAIELANELASRQSMDRRSAASGDSESGATPSSELGDSGGEGSWSQKLSIRRSKSPSKPAERRTFTEEMAAMPSEDVTPEAQEAYNLLVVKGSAKERNSSTSSSFQALREKRAQRQAQQQSTSERSSSLRNGHRSNMNLRKPQGIPSRASMPAASSSGGGMVAQLPGSEEEVNPLRRLRDSQSTVVKPRPSSTRSELTNGRPNEHLHRPNLNPNLSFFAKLKEQEMENGSGEHSDEGNSNTPSIPPRVPLKKSTVNVKPRERRHPLDLSASLNGGLRSKLDTDDSVFIDQCNSSGRGLDQSAARPFSISSCDSQLSVNVKAVTASAQELGIDNGTDSFWAEQVNFGEFACAFEPDSDDEVEEHAPIPGRYKTSDTVSYEDLMEFALDGPHPRYRLLLFWVLLASFDLSFSLSVSSTLSVTVTFPWFL